MAKGTESPPGQDADSVTKAGGEEHGNVTSEMDDILASWRPHISNPRTLEWRDGWLENGYCRSCRQCCGPQESDVPYPMPLLPSQQGPEAARRFHLLAPDMAYLAGPGCKSATPSGCALPREDRPVACNLFPLALVNGTIQVFMYCPVAWHIPMDRLREIGKGVASWLTDFPPSDLRHLDRRMDPAEASRVYFPLFVSVL
ncbi:MAG: hypothetical protein LBR22_07735 [Desulfovibrio sp.]|jgi:hypothetical protein|nr:hypothetical protein [Desulfovibrio sp.]